MIVDPSEHPTMPHCDAAILHAPGECRYCDLRPDWQEYRLLARIAFTGDEATGDRSPCPSTWSRSAEVRDRWHGNVAAPPAPPVITPAPPSDAGTCQIPPRGWWCSRTPGHPGPCATRRTLLGHLLRVVGR